MFCHEMYMLKSFHGLGCIWFMWAYVKILSSAFGVRKQILNRKQLSLQDAANVGTAQPAGAEQPTRHTAATTNIKSEWVFTR